MQLLCSAIVRFLTLGSQDNIRWLEDLLESFMATAFFDNLQTHIVGNDNKVNIEFKSDEGLKSPRE